MSFETPILEPLNIDRQLRRDLDREKQAAATSMPLAEQFVENENERLRTIAPLSE